MVGCVCVVWYTCVREKRERPPYWVSWGAGPTTAFSHLVPRATWKGATNILPAQETLAEGGPRGQGGGVCALLREGPTGFCHLLALLSE